MRRLNFVQFNEYITNPSISTGRVESEMVTRIVWGRGDERQRVEMQCQMGCTGTSSHSRKPAKHGMEAIMKTKGEHCLQYQPNPNPPGLPAQWNILSKVQPRVFVVTLVQRAFCTQLSPGLPSFLVVSAAIWTALRLCPSPKDREGVLGGNPQQGICVIIPGLFMEGEKLTCQMPLHGQKENCRLKKKRCQWIFGQGSILQWDVPGHAMTWSPDCIWAAIVLQLHCCSLPVVQEGFLKVPVRHFTLTSPFPGIFFFRLTCPSFAVAVSQLLQKR